MIDIYVIYYNIELNSVLRPNYITFEFNYDYGGYEYDFKESWYEHVFETNMKENHYA